MKLTVSQKKQHQFKGSDRSIFEDINYAADGGLYAELVKNRSFEFPQHLMGGRLMEK